MLYAFIYHVVASLLAFFLSVAQWMHCDVGKMLSAWFRQAFVHSCDGVTSDFKEQDFGGWLGLVGTKMNHVSYSHMTKMIGESTCVGQSS